jgi:Predicted endonuclease containing a URI domain
MIRWRIMNYVYILRCADGSLYTGWTNDLEKRVKTHNAGKGAKYTKTRLPVELVYYEEYEEKGEALSRELSIKKLKKTAKEKLILKQHIDND